MGCRWSTASCCSSTRRRGRLPQTRFVLRKALAAKLPVVLVVNKVDRPDARISEVVDETYELFLDLLDDTHDQDALELPGRLRIGEGRPRLDRSSLPTVAMPDSPDLEPLFRTIIETVPAPTYSEGAPLQAHVTNLDASPFLGRLALCRVHEGTLTEGPERRLAQARRLAAERQDHRAARHRGARASAGRVSRTGRHHRGRRDPRDQHRRDARRPGATRSPSRSSPSTSRRSR